VRDYSSVPVFGSSVYPVIIIVQKTKPFDNSLLVETVESINEELKITYSKQIDQNQLENKLTWSPAFYKFGSNIISRLSKKFIKLKETSEIYGAATVSESYEIRDFLHEFNAEDEKDYFKLINTGTIDRYTSLWGIKPTHYLKSKFYKPIAKREKLKSFSLRRYKQSSQAKIIIGGMSKFLECYLDNEGDFLAGKSTIVVFANNINPTVLLAILNSKLLTFCYKNLYSSLSLSGGYMRIGTSQIGNLPIAIPSEIQQKEIGERVDQLQELNKKLAPIRDDKLSDRDELKNEIDKIDKEIDNLVYDIYGLTEEERKIVEGMDS
jgi:hypothetical protein